MTFEQLLKSAYGSFFGPRGFQIGKVRAYLRDGGDPNQQDENGKNLIHMLADDANAEAIELMAAHGADLDVQDAQGWTALHWAVDADCDTSSRNARRAPELPTVRKLIECGADESIRSRDGETPREIAAAYGHIEVGLYDSISLLPKTRLDNQ